MQTALIENLSRNERIIREFQSKGLISEDLTRADIEIIKRLIVSGIEGILTNLFIRRNIATQGINWR
jgi:hypothetical protein